MIGNVGRRSTCTFEATGKTTMGLVSLEGSEREIVHGEDHLTEAIQG